MGNCQTAEASAAIVLHPGGKIERLYWSATAGDVMLSNPGHYVAIVLTPPSPSPSELPRRHLKLLRPEDALHNGNVYRLVTFQEVVKGLGSRRHARLRRLLLVQQLKETGAVSSELEGWDGGEGREKLVQQVEATEQNAAGVGIAGGALGHFGAGGGRRRQWRPALQSIAEVGSSSSS